MSIRNLVRASAQLGFATPRNAPIRIDSTTSTPFYNGAGSGTTEKELVDVSSTQSLTGKTLVAPVITGGSTANAAAGAAGSSVTLFNNKVLVDNTVTDFYTVTVPNVIVGASIELLVSSALGDGDSTDSAIYTIGISRLVGAATKAVASSKSVVGATAGAGANAVITATVSGMTGAVGATQTFTVTIKNARSAGAADNHPTTSRATLINNKAGGATIATV